MKLVKVLLFAAALAFVPMTDVCAQLKKIAHIEKVKSFTNGSVVLNKTSTDSVAIFSVTLDNNSRFHESIVFFLGNKEDMSKNLHDFSSALKEGKKGDYFDFTAIGAEYILTYDKVLGQACFKVSKPLSTSSDFGRLFKRTIDDIIEYMEKYEK